MNHIQYHLSLTRRDDLLRQAGDRRRANEAALVTEASSSVPSRREALKLRPFRLRRSASHG